MLKCEKSEEVERYNKMQREDAERGRLAEMNQTFGEHEGITSHTGGIHKIKQALQQWQNPNNPWKNRKEFKDHVEALILIDLECSGEYKPETIRTCRNLRIQKQLIPIIRKIAGLKAGKIKWQD